MDIKSVFDELQAAAEKNNKLYTEVSDKSKVVANKVAKNYYEIVHPVETELAQLLKSIRETARFTEIPPMDSTYQNLFLGPEVDEDKFILRLKTSWRGVHVTYLDRGSYGELWTAIHNATEYSMSKAQLVMCSAWLASEEKANELVELIKKAYIPLIEWHKQKFEEVGCELSATVDHLKGILENSHTVVENKDGTVEIQLGGKTYIGRVKEA